MDEEKPKITAWNYDQTNNASFDPSAPQNNQITPSVADGMLRDTTQHFKTKWLLRSGLLVPVAVIIMFMSHVLGALIAAGICFNLARVIAAGNSTPGKRTGIIITSLLGVAFLIFAFL